MNTSTATEPELVVLVDPSGRPIGQTEKSLVHSRETAMHLAFSCYVFNEHDELLLTRRALSKLTWPGVWTNSFCGHPAPGEAFEAAIARRAEFELGLVVDDVRVVAPEFSYRAVDASGIVEHEFCPVFVARATNAPQPNPDEVVEYAWVRLDAAVSAAEHAPALLSPWSVLQLPLVAAVH